MSNKELGNLGLWDAYQNRDFDRMNILLPFSDTDTVDRCFFDACLYGSSDAVSFLFPFINKAKDRASELGVFVRSLCRECGEIGTVDLLLTVSDINKTDALKNAVTAGKTDLFFKLLPFVTKKTAKISELMRAAFFGQHMEMIEALLPLADQDYLQTMALEDATRTKNKDIVAKVLAFNGSSGVVSALYHAIRLDDLDIFSLLAPHAELDGKNEDTFLDLAFHKACKKTLTAISEYTSATSHNRVLFWSVMCGRQDVFDMIYDRADPEAVLRSLTILIEVDAIKKNIGMLESRLRVDRERKALQGALDHIKTPLALRKKL